MAGSPYVYGLSLDSAREKSWYLLQEDECLIENHPEIESAIPNKKKFTDDSHIRTTPVTLDAKLRKKYLNSSGQLQFNGRVLSPEIDTSSENSIAFVLSHYDETQEGESPDRFSKLILKIKKVCF